MINIIITSDQIFGIGSGAELDHGGDRRLAE
jgi:hypothetical protein